MIVGVDVQIRYDFICQKWLQYSESFIIELGNFNPQEFIDISLVGQYLSRTRKKGIIYGPDTSKGLECYVDADFAGGRKEANANDDNSDMS